MFDPNSKSSDILSDSYTDRYFKAWHKRWQIWTINEEKFKIYFNELRQNALKKNQVVQLVPQEPQALYPRLPVTSL
jgi:hypothetical protein